MGTVAPQIPGRATCIKGVQDGVLALPVERADEVAAGRETHHPVTAGAHRAQQFEQCLGLARAGRAGDQDVAGFGAGDERHAGHGDVAGHPCPLQQALRIAGRKDLPAAQQPVLALHEAGPVDEPQDGHKQGRKQHERGHEAADPGDQNTAPDATDAGRIHDLTDARLDLGSIPPAHHRRLAGIAKRLVLHLRHRVLQGNVAVIRARCG